MGFNLVCSGPPKSTQTNHAIHKFLHCSLCMKTKAQVPEAAEGDVGRGKDSR